MLRNKRLLMLISLFVAVGMWVYVMGDVDPDTTYMVSGVKVEMQGEDSLESEGLHAELDSPKVVAVTVKGKRSQVNKIRKKGLEAYIDVSTCDYGKNETEIKVKLPDDVTGVTVEKMSKGTAVFTVK